MKKLILSGLLFLGFSSLGYGQTDDPGCTKLVEESDIVCSDETDCDFTTGCTSQSFHVDCGGTYQFSAWVACGGTNCGHCASCVSIYTDPPGITPVDVVSTLDDCPGSCNKLTTTTALSPGDYIMYVCLIACTEEDAQACCDENNECKAYGCLQWGASTGCP